MKKKFIILILLCLSIYFFKERKKKDKIDSLDFISWTSATYSVKSICEYKRKNCFCHAYEFRKNYLQFTLRDKDCNFLKKSKKANIKGSLLSNLKFNNRMNTNDLNHKDIYVKIDEEKLYYFSFDKQDNLIKNNMIGEVSVIN